jgi:site-specific DNA-methyltransferase (adenine-specific)
MPNELFYGDNLDVLRDKLGDETVDLCYIDPPFHSKRNYNQVYNNLGSEDRAHAQAFVDTWTWDSFAGEGFQQILSNGGGRFTRQTVALINGLQQVLGKGSLLAYLVSIVLRLAEIHRVLNSTGSFYLHCDPTASHYLKLVLDSVFIPRGGDFQNEIVWHYMTGGASKSHYAKKHDVLLYYTKSGRYNFYPERIKEPRSEKALARARNPKGARIRSDDTTKLPTDVWAIPALNPMSVERSGYPTQKPADLLRRVITASSDVGDTVLDAYCGCGTTMAVAQELGRKWVGIDITYQSIALVLKRLEEQFGAGVVSNIKLHGIPIDMEAVVALASRKDGRLRKEFEKWAVLTYTHNRARINDSKGLDEGIDGVAFFSTGATDNAKVVFQVKSGNVGRGDIAKLNSDRLRAGAELAVFLTLQPPTGGMTDEANAAGAYAHKLTGRTYPRIQIVTIQEMVEQHKRLEVPTAVEVLETASAIAQGK